MKKYYSEVLQDVIGEPILDQYDLSYPASFYGTTQDDYVTGTLLVVSREATRTNNRTTFVEGDRGKLFSKTQVNAQPVLDSTYGSAEVKKNPSYASRITPWYEKVSHHFRVIQCVDEKERFYDSCLPDIKSCLNADNTPLWSTHDDPQYWLSPYGNVKTQNVGYLLFNAAPISVNKQLSNNYWTWSFPYEERYKSAKRQKSTLEVIGSIPSVSTTNWYPNSFNELKQRQFPETFNTFFPLLPGKQQDSTTDKSFRVDTSLPENSLGSYRVLIPADVNLNSLNSVSNELITGTLSNDDMIKFMFGFGDLNNITYTAYNLNEDEEEPIVSSSYFTGFELQNWTYQASPPSGPVTTWLSSSFNGRPIPISGTVETRFNAQFDQYSGPVIVKWIAPSGNIGLGDGYPAERYRFDSGDFDSKTVIEMGQSIVGVETGWREYPWMLVAREGKVNATFDESNENLSIYNYVSSSQYYYYSTERQFTNSSILTGSTAIYWPSGSAPSRHWVLGSFLSSSNFGSGRYKLIYKMPHPSVRGGKTVSTQKVEITSSYPWKLAYSRAVSSPTTDYFYSSFSSMPGFSSTTTGIDYVIEKLQGTDTTFEGTGRIEFSPQLLTDFTSSLFPPGAYMLRFNYVKTALSGTSNGVDRAFIDNVNILAYAQGQLTGNFDPSNRIGYSHYPEFRQILRDTRTSPYFPGSGFKSTATLYRRISSSLDAVRTATGYLQSNSYGGYEFGIAPVIRGWKYGIYNGLPTHSKVVFRRNKYGQFRDMLEQRLFTKFLNDDKSVSENVAKGDRTKLQEKSSVTVQDGPVTVKFVRQEARIDSNGLGKIFTYTVDPILTDSQNLSLEATSDVPYFDGESRSRPSQFSPDGALNTEMVMVTAAAPSTVSTAPALTTAISPTNFTITTRRQ